ncbi:hypothetical protein CCACVL1_06001 [Corchorus capsularis]|uniref:Protein decapping 5-like n=1 Tax=Corchorus capsularis TaxID=210143 RepID=A0A1R3JHY4_COCAP|nr:hypothetical protein CCACVL1_06001 [Corchorus capsularis]
MATAETSSQSADSYIGSFISLISKSEIRYEGVLFHINPHESSIGLKNVRSFGTEGRKKDGPQVAPSDKVYDFIYFRGSDIKDLQVLSSLSVPSVPAIPDDPAIIQSHYQYPASSSSLSHSSASSMTSLSSNSQLGLTSSTFQGSVPQYQPVGNMVSWGFEAPTTVNSNEHSMPMYWQGLNGLSGGYSYLQQSSLLRPLPGLLPSAGPQQMQHSTIDASIPSGAPNFPEIPDSLPQPSSFDSLKSTLLPSLSASSMNSVLLPPSSSGSQNSTVLPPSGSLNSTFVSSASSTFPANIPMSHAAQASNYTAINDPNASSLTLSSNLPSASPLTYAVNTNNVAQFSEKSKLTLRSTFPNISMSTPKPPINGTSGSKHPEVTTPSLVTPGQLLQSAPTSPPTVLPSSLPLQTAQKDIEVVQTSALEPLSTDINEAQAPILPTPSVSSGKMNEASLDSRHHDKGLERGKRNGPYRAAVRTHQRIRGHVEERENKANGVIRQSHQTNNKIHGRGRRNGLYGTASHSHPSNKRHTGGIEKTIGTALCAYHGGRGRAKGRTNMISRSATKFTEDFDFEAMNEKFNKDEVWGQLGKSMKGISEDNGDANDSQEDNEQHEGDDGLPKIDIKPVYVKDEFFDSLSFNTFDREPKKERSKFSEQKKLDAETFGGFRVNRGGRGGRGVGRGGWLRGSGYGRGYGHAGRGQGRAVWSRET